MGEKAPQRPEKKKIPGQFIKPNPDGWDSPLEKERKKKEEEVEIKIDEWIEETKPKP